MEDPVDSSMDASLDMQPISTTSKVDHLPSLDSEEMAQGELVSTTDGIQNDSVEAHNRDNNESTATESRPTDMTTDDVSTTNEVDPRSDNTYDDEDVSTSDLIRIENDSESRNVEEKAGESEASEDISSTDDRADGLRIDEESESRPENSIENEVYNMADGGEPAEPPTENASLQRPPKRTVDVITIDSDSDDSSVCHVDSYQATASEAKKMRLGYSTSESSSEFSSEESDSEFEDNSEVITHVPSYLSEHMKAVTRKRTNSTDIKLNESFTSDELKEKFLSSWSKRESFEAENIKLHNEPFQICTMNNFLSNADVISDIVNDMNTLEWTRKIMDLYEFHRTSDLKDMTWQRSIKSMYELLKNDVMKWVASVTGLNLTHISASCALYGPGDHLLVHDDLLEDRKVAFIFYMAPWQLCQVEKSNADEDGVASTANDDEAEGGWRKDMGGELEFLSSDKDNKPLTTVRSLLPRNNLFAFFKVGHDSFHQVAEVTSFDYPRLTINGWFHGPVEADENSVEKEFESSSLPTMHTPNDAVLQNELCDWISSVYLTPKCKNQILEKFEETSEISLVNFFTQQKYDSVLSELQSDEIEWEKRGPVNLRHYAITPIEKINGVLKGIIDVLTSNHFVHLLQGYTGLPLQHYCKLEVQKWTVGDYTVLPTKEEYSVTEVDVIIYLGCPNRLLKGGTITYLLPEDADADPVISLGLNNNALNMVCSESGLAKFTKYLSKLSFHEGEHFYMLVCSYRHETAAATTTTKTDE